MDIITQARRPGVGKVGRWVAKGIPYHKENVLQARGLATATLSSYGNQGTTLLVLRLAYTRQRHSPEAAQAAEVANEAEK